jgi:purine-nucleoside phosphorylase
VTSASPAPDPVASARALAERTGVESHDVAVVLGTGWNAAARELGEIVAELPVTDLGGFPVPHVEGHSGLVQSARCGPRRVLTFLGRVHAYEGHDLPQVVHGVRTAIAAGCRTIVLTNAAGGLAPEYAVGQVVLLRDHLNLTARSPLVGPRFVDLTDLYSRRLRSVARSADPDLAEGVYAGLPGPHFETPAEIRMLRLLGADLVGMSTVHEAIAAHAEGAEVLGLSLVTNAAAGMGHSPDGEPIDHRGVLAVGQATAAATGRLIAEIIRRL